MAPPGLGLDRDHSGGGLAVRLVVRGPLRAPSQGVDHLLLREALMGDLATTTMVVTTTTTDIKSTTTVDMEAIGSIQPGITGCHSIRRFSMDLRSTRMDTMSRVGSASLG